MFKSDAHVGATCHGRRSARPRPRRVHLHQILRVATAAITTHPHMAGLGCGAASMPCVPGMAATRTAATAATGTGGGSGGEGEGTSPVIPAAVAPALPRTYDPDGLRCRAGVVCFDAGGDGGGLRLFLVTTSSPTWLPPRKWILPGGGVDPGETDAVAAAREAMEEGGVAGCLSRQVWVEEARGQRTRWFLLRVDTVAPADAWLEAYKRQRQWHAWSEALNVLRPSHVETLKAVTAAVLHAAAGSGEVEDEVVRAFALALQAHAPGTLFPDAP